MATGIYAIRRIGTDKRYIGQSVNIERRKIAHLSDLRRNRHSSDHLQKSYNKFGEAAFEFEILASGMSPDDADMLTLAEQEFMDKLCAYYNAAPAAGSVKGITSYWKNKKFPQEMIDKMSDAKKGKPSPFKGKVHSEETKLKMSLSRKGKQSPNKGVPRAKEASAKQSETMKARMTEDRRRIYSDAAKKRRKISDETRQKRSESITEWWAARKAASEKEK